MSIRFHPRAALCTLVVLAGFGWAVSRQLPSSLLGWTPMEREGRLPLTQGGAAEPDTQVEIVETVLLYEARRPNRRNVCLKLAPEGTALEQEKQAIRSLQARLAKAPAERERIVAELDRLRNPARQWLLPSGTGTDEPPLTDESARQLRTAETALLGAPAGGDVDLTLNIAELPVAFQTSDPRCNTLFFTAPAVAGEVAFVETSYRTSEGREEAALYAVVRREERWEVGALAKTWTS